MKLLEEFRIDVVLLRIARHAHEPLAHIFHLGFLRLRRMRLRYAGAGEGRCRIPPASWSFLSPSAVADLRPGLAVGRRGQGNNAEGQRHKRRRNANHRTGLRRTAAVDMTLDSPQSIPADPQYAIAPTGQAVRLRQWSLETPTRPHGATIVTIRQSGVCNDGRKPARLFGHFACRLILRCIILARELRRPGSVCHGRSSTRPSESGDGSVRQRSTCRCHSSGSPTEEASQPGLVDVRWRSRRPDADRGHATLLDWLEGHGIAPAKSKLNEAGLMTVRWG